METIGATDILSSSLFMVLNNDVHILFIFFLVVEKIPKHEFAHQCSSVLRSTPCGTRRCYR